MANNYEEQSVCTLLVAASCFYDLKMAIGLVQGYHLKYFGWSYMLHESIAHLKFLVS
jgi:hypothetical protein